MNRAFPGGGIPQMKFQMINHFPKIADAADERISHSSLFTPTLPLLHHTQHTHTMNLRLLLLSLCVGAASASPSIRGAKAVTACEFPAGTHPHTIPCPHVASPFAPSVSRAHSPANVFRDMGGQELVLSTHLRTNRALSGVYRQKRRKRAPCPGS